MSVSSNPFVDQVESVVRVVEDEPERVLRTLGSQAGIDTVGLSRQLPQVFDAPSEHVVLVGAHGGAGVSTLSVLTGLTDGGSAWPVTFPDTPNGVLVVCRSNMSGFAAAQAAASAVAAGLVPAVSVLGLVVVDDVPERRLPRALRDELTVVGAAFPEVFRFPWIDELRFSAASQVSLHGKAARAASSLTEIDQFWMEGKD